MYIFNKPALLSLDSGCEGDCIRESECYRLNIPIKPLDDSDVQIPTQADGHSPLNIVGKVKFEAERDKLMFSYEGYVAKNLQSAILCGGAFLERNEIVQELKERRIKISNKHYLFESSPLCPPVADIAIRNVGVSHSLAIAPGDFYDFEIPADYQEDQEYIMSPVSSIHASQDWDPQLAKAVGRNLRFRNLTPNFLEIEKNIPILQISTTEPRYQFVSYPKSETNGVQPTDNSSPESTKLEKDKILKSIEIDEDLPDKLKQKLFSAHSEHINVFNGDLSRGYNGFSGDHTVDFNFKNGIPPPVHFGCVPSYNKREDDVLMQAMIDRLEDLNVVSKANDIGIIPKFASPTLLVLKNSARTLPPGQYNKLSIQEKLRYNRFVLCQNKLNEYVEKIPHQYTTIDDTINMVGSFEFVITTDLTDSFWQRPISNDKLPYMAFHSPFKGTYVFLRSSQGFLNQSEGLEQLVRCVLQDCIAEGWCRVHADNIYILGHTAEQTVERWQLVLEAMQKNNLKLSPKKTSCFPKKLDLLGWTKEGKFLVPDIHRQHCISIAELPKTAKQLRSFIGSYRTFQKCLQNTAFILKDLEEFLAKHSSSSSQQLVWNDDLKKQFEDAKEKLKALDKLYLPKPEDQLVLTSDWCKYGISATLWAVVDNKFLVVARMSTRTDKDMEKMQPCEGETSAVFVAGKCPAFSVHIKSANLRTICLMDNKTTCQAAKLLQQGKFSTSRIINQLLTAISELNLEFQHLSGKMGQNLTDDYGSRNPVICGGGEHCKVCSFVSDCARLTTNSSISFCVTNQTIIASIDNMEKEGSNQLVNDIITGESKIPFGNRNAMKFLQDQDPDLQCVKRELTSGQRPQTKNTKINSIKRYLQRDANITIARDGCLVSNKLGKRFAKKELIVIPRNISKGLLYGMHINLKHPTPFQLKRVVDTKFFVLDRDKIIKDIWLSCALCQSLAEIPQEIENYQANQIPDHPGKEFTVDIMKHNRKIITVASDNFSGFISTCFIKSEEHGNLLEGIIQTITPFKASSMSKIRVDQAPGFRKLMKKKADLQDMGIELDPGEVKNKNALALVDRKMSELRKEIRKLAPSNNVINVKILAQATATVNEKVRDSGFSSKEILFSRDQFTQENIALEDEKIATETMARREKDNVYTAKSKASVQKEAVPANATKGQLVFLKKSESKTHRRDLYLVLEVDDNLQSLQICKLLHTMSDLTPTLQPQNITYKVKQTDVFLAPNQPIETEMYEFANEPSYRSPPLPIPPRTHETPVQNKHNFRKDLADSDDEYQSSSDLEDNYDEEADQTENNDDEENYHEEDNDDEEDDQTDWLIDLNDDEPNSESGPDVMEQLAVLERDQINQFIEHPLQGVDLPDQQVAQGHPRQNQQEQVHSIWDEVDNLELNPPLPPINGAMILYFCHETQQTCKAKIETTFKTTQRKWPGWFNITNEGARKITSVNLGVVRWKYHDEPTSPPRPTLPPPEPSRLFIPQVDGNYTLTLFNDNEDEHSKDGIKNSNEFDEINLDDHSTSEAESNSYDWDNYASSPDLSGAPWQDLATESVENTHHLLNQEPADPIGAFRLSQELHHFVPTLPPDGSFLPNQRYLIPPHLQDRWYRPIPVRPIIRSLSEGDLSHTRPSYWTRGIHRLRNFVQQFLGK